MAAPTQTGERGSGIRFEIKVKEHASGGVEGGNGGVGVEANGEGGFSYYNPEAVLLLLDSRLEFAPSSSVSHHRKNKRLAKLWKSNGPGFVHILPQMADHTCQVTF